MAEAGLESVIGKEADRVIRLLGQPRLDVTEGDMRKLQFRATPCVLDIFFYPSVIGQAPLASWVEARRASDGAEVDRAACLRALSGGR